MSDERIITAAIVTTGEKSDGHYLKELVKKSKETGMEVGTVIGDTAYSGKENLQYAQAEDFQLVSKLNPNITGETSHRKVVFEFNKDAGMYVQQVTWLFEKHELERKIKQLIKQKHTHLI